MILFYDTETTGLPLDYKAHVHDVDNWPRLVELAWIVASVDGEELLSQERIIKADGFEIPAEAERIHGISTEISLDNGVDINLALAEFSVASHLTQLHVGHNLAFDRHIVGAEMVRLGWEIDYERLRDADRYDTMFKSMSFLKIPNKNGRGNKFPKLEELYRELFDHEIEGVHSAMGDVRATMDCYFAMS